VHTHLCIQASDIHYKHYSKGPRNTLLYDAIIVGFLLYDFFSVTLPKPYYIRFWCEGKAVHIMLDSNALLVHACTLLKQTVAIAKYLITTVAC